MIKKIFFTSGIIMCMMNPSFADGAGIVTVDNTTVPPTVTPVVNAGCNSGTLNATEGDVSLKAVWLVNVTSVIYRCGNEGENYTGSITGTAPSNGSATYGQDFTFAASTGEGFCAQPGYGFVGWNCSALDATMPSVDGENNPVPRTGTVSWVYNGVNNGSVTCTAVFSPNTINLTWDADGGTMSEEVNGETVTFATTSGSCVYDSSISLPPTPTRVGYTFAGWDVVSVTDPQDESESQVTEAQNENPQEPEPSNA